MFKDEYVFSQLVKFLEYEKFKYIVKKYNGNKYVKSYTCWNQLLTMMFVQLSNRESLRDLIVAMEAKISALLSAVQKFQFCVQAVGLEYHHHPMIFNIFLVPSIPLSLSNFRKEYVK